MPNHISNRVWIVAPDGDWRKEDDAYKHLVALMKTEETPFDFNVLIPYPEQYKVLDDARNEAEKQPNVNWATLPKDGFNSGGYEWCNANWGTKWNAYDIGEDYDAILFCTAWSTPRPIWAELSKRFPDMRIEVEYADEDRGNNCGKLTYANGELVAFQDMSKFPEGELFARAIIAEQRAAHHKAEAKALAASAGIGSRQREGRG